MYRNEQINLNVDTIGSKEQVRLRFSTDLKSALTEMTIPKLLNINTETIKNLIKLKEADFEYIVEADFIAETVNHILTEIVDEDYGSKLDKISKHFAEVIFQDFEQIQTIRLNNQVRANADLDFDIFANEIALSKLANEIGLRVMENPTIFVKQLIQFTDIDTLISAYISEYPWLFQNLNRVEQGYESYDQGKFLQLSETAFLKVILICLYQSNEIHEILGPKLIDTKHLNSFTHNRARLSQISLDRFTESTPVIKSIFDVFNLGNYDNQLKLIVGKLAKLEVESRDFDFSNQQYFQEFFKALTEVFKSKKTANFSFSDAACIFFSGKRLSDIVRLILPNDSSVSNYILEKLKSEIKQNLSISLNVYLEQAIALEISEGYEMTDSKVEFLKKFVSGDLSKEIQDFFNQTKIESLIDKHFESELPPEKMKLRVTYDKGYEALNFENKNYKDGYFNRWVEIIELMNDRFNNIPEITAYIKSIANTDIDLVSMAKKLYHILKLYSEKKTPSDTQMTKFDTLAKANSFSKKPVAYSKQFLSISRLITKLNFND